MTKRILLNKDTSKQMSFREVLDQYENMIWQQIYRTRNQVPKHNQMLSEEDIFQELSFATWRAFEEYDSNRGILFHTFLTYKLRGKTSKLIQFQSAEKRSTLPNSLDVEVYGTETGDTLYTFIESEKSVEDEVVVAFTLDEIISFCKENDREKCLVCLLNKKDYPVTELAEDLGISRVAANNRVNILQKKLQTLISKGRKYYAE